MRCAVKFDWLRSLSRFSMNDGSIYSGFGRRGLPLYCASQKTHDEESAAGAALGVDDDLRAAVLEEEFRHA
jgi:hypothetical protein